MKLLGLILCVNHLIACLGRDLHVPAKGSGDAVHCSTRIEVACVGAQAATVQAAQVWRDVKG